jgi:beta-fructofuranosidase
MCLWDFWVQQDGDTWHGYHLQAPQCMGRSVIHGNEHIAHATSTDLVNWTNHGPVIVPIPHTWNDRACATGSVVRHEGRWWMPFTGHGWHGSGAGLAVSDDLTKWERVGDGPVIDAADTFEGTWDGRELRWRMIADPHVYPEKLDGWFYAAFNSQEVDQPVRKCGCVTMMRSRDLLAWEPHAVIAYAGWFEWMEAPAFWTRNGRWYLYFGGAHDHGMPDDLPGELKPLGSRANFVYTSDAFDGPYRPLGSWIVTLPDGSYPGYIIRVSPGPDGGDVALLQQDYHVSLPYRVTYPAEGGLRLGEPLA